MIPIQLTLEGIYSYQARQTIDFNKLTEANLFGIFGAVGSGKSSILEAITFALYGETERLNSRDKRTYNMMNLKSNRSYIEFDFQNYEGQTYRVTREFKRNSKKFEEIKSPTVAFYISKNEQWFPIENPNIEEIIGLSYQNFKRTIIIPQGQFKEFLELGESDRTKMMKEIFNLHQFDLQDKVSNLSKQNRSELDQLEGQLKGFENISEETIQTQKELLAEAKFNYELFENKHKIIHDSFQKLTKIKEEIELLQIKNQEFEKLNSQSEYFKNLEIKINQFEKIYLTFHQLIESQKSKNKEIEQLKSNLISENILAESLKNELNLIQQKIIEIKPDFENLNNKKTELDDLNFIAKIHQKNQEIQELKLRSEKGLIAVENVKIEQSQTSHLIEKLEKEIEDNSKKLWDDSVLMEVEKWFLEHKNLQHNLEQIQKEIQLKGNDIKVIEIEFQEKKINPNTFSIKIENQLNELENQEKQIDSQLNHFLIQQKLASFTHNLHDDQPCPLCGSVEHPEILEVEDVSTKIQTLETEKFSIQQKKKNFQNIKSEFEQKLMRKKLIEDQLNLEKIKFQEIEIQINNHLDNFIWKAFNPKQFDEFTQAKSKNSSLKNQINEQNSLLKETQEKLKKTNIDLEKFQAALQDFKIKEAQKEAEIQNEITNLKSLKFDDFTEISWEEINHKINLFNAEIQNTEREYNSLNQKLNEVSPKLASQNTKVEITQNQIQETENQLNQINQKIDLEIQYQSLESIENVKSILAQNLDAVTSKKEIQTFQVNFKVLKNEIEILNNNLQNVEFTEEKYNSELLNFKQSKENLKLITEEVAKISAEVERLEKEFTTKESLLKSFSKLQNRDSNLKTMFKMFKSAGFVQYVSSIYLRQLCDNANVRFHRMTRNQLSLQLSESNDFEIIDYLNEGRSRSVKTLSGGQAFQASLSLALALAESVQANAKADKNFFFIDEGFGTQDSESVNIVFETLSNLVKENRIVGIISHVDELKEQIPKTLSVIKNPEKGSLIEIS